MGVQEVAAGPAGTAAQRAHAQLREAVLSGALAPGSMLSENDLAASLQMSRTPVRAALARLQEEGWVTIYPQRGALVRELTADEVREAAQVRHALEVAGVRQAAPGARVRLASQQAEGLDAQRAALRSGDVGGFTSHAMGFHRAFVALAGNGLMLATYDRLQDLQQLSIARSAPRLLDDPDTVLLEHQRLLDTAVDGDWVAFAERLGEHQAAHHDPGT
ncbi:GntR family transcriptional regulator [Quadrisphaera setariae]|uniref:GntR family transcriptional regulator n=1 Tax=Quadrisphaera setariae TaxID=2593304 RepID=UPI001C9BF414|nr:GntR family transcriptional regulator [Quadrisphaera setariae]